MLGGQRPYLIGANSTRRLPSGIEKLAFDESEYRDYAPLHRLWYAYNLAN